MKLLSSSSRSWALSIMLGLVLALISLTYLAFPRGYGEDGIARRLQLRLPGPTIQLTNTVVDTQTICTQSLVEEDRGFPVAMISREGSNGCTDDRFLNILGLIFNVILYSVIVRAGVFAISRWHR
jgi:hypothetical protein